MQVFSKSLSKNFGFLFLLAAVQSHANIAPPSDPGWEQTGEDDGVTLFRKEVADSPVVSFRGYTVIDAPMTKIAQVLDDSSRRKEWVANVVEAYTVKRINPLVRWEYNQTEGSILFQDRDFVFTAVNEINRKKREMWIRLKSGELAELAPKDGVQRGELLSSTYYLREVEPGAKTFVQVEISADPKGNIPKWLVNLFQKKWPVKTLNGIRDQVKKPGLAENKLLKLYLESKEGPDVLTPETLKGSIFEKYLEKEKPATSTPTTHLAG